MELWNGWKTPPPSALKTIKGGRLKGMTDISPQWRYQIMTEKLGPCGVGWKFVITKQWAEEGAAGEKMAFVNIDLFVKVNDVWSEAIPGTGGSGLIKKETAGLHSSDEAYKMATTDAITTAMKMLGVGADIYRNLWDGSKYKVDPEAPPEPAPLNLNGLKSALACSVTLEELKAFADKNDKKITDAPNKKAGLELIEKRQAEIIGKLLDECETLAEVDEFYNNAAAHIDVAPNKEAILDLIGEKQAELNNQEGAK